MSRTPAGLERTKSAASSYRDPEFVPEVHLSPIASRVSQRDAESRLGHDTQEGSSDADTRVVPPEGEKGHIAVGWDGPQDPGNPLNMRAWRKW